MQNSRFFYRGYGINMLCTKSSMINQLKTNSTEVTALHPIFSLTSDWKKATTNMASKKHLSLQDVLNLNF